MKYFCNSICGKGLNIKCYLFVTVFLFTNISLILAQNGAGKITIPMDLSTSVPKIEVSINGKGPFNFELDTGAGISIIDKKLASTLNLNVIDQMKVGSPGSNTPTLVDVISISNMSISDIRLKDLSMIVMDLGDIPNIGGILSLKLFSEFLVTLNYPWKLVSFEEGELNDLNETVLRYSTTRGVPGIQIEISGRKKEAFLDTGYPDSFAFPYSIRDEVNFISPPVEAGTAYYVDVSFKMWRTRLDGQIKIGDVVYESPEIILEERDRDFITIGFGAIKNFAVTIDQKNSLLKLKRVESLEEPDQNKTIIYDNEFTGRYGGVRTITFENGDLYIQRDGGLKLILENTSDDLYSMVLPDGLVAQNILPQVRFDRNENNEVYRITFIHEDGTEEYVPKDQ